MTRQFQFELMFLTMAALALLCSFFPAPYAHIGGVVAAALFLTGAMSLYVSRWERAYTHLEEQYRDREAVALEASMALYYILREVGKQDEGKGWKALENLRAGRRVHPDVLPWEPLGIDLAKRIAEPLKREWASYRAMADEPEIDAMIRALIEDPTEDNAVCLIREIGRQVLKPPQPEPQSL